MKLLVDIGNSRIKWAVAEHGSLRGPHDLLRPAGDPTPALAAAWGGLQPTAVAYCSVVPGSVTTALREWVGHRWGVDALEIRACGRGGPLTSGYREPARLGADRWANLHGVRVLLGAVDAVIVDAGTAVTVDALRADGQHLGGAILAGLDASRAGLSVAAPTLPAAGDTTALPAVDTATAIAGGTLAGLAGAIERVAEEVGRDLARPVHLLTGGDANTLRPWLGDHWQYDELLTLRGVDAVSEGMECAGSHCS